MCQIAAGGRLIAQFSSCHHCQRVSSICMLLRSSCNSNAAASLQGHRLQRVSLLKEICFNFIVHFNYISFRFVRFVYEICVKKLASCCWQHRLLVMTEESESPNKKVQLVFLLGLGKQFYYNVGGDTLRKISFWEIFRLSASTFVGHIRKR